MITDITIFLGGALAGATGGFFVFRYYLTPPSGADVQRYMQRVVNVEEVEERHNLVRKELHDAGRRTMPRPDAGPPAKVHKMRARRRTNPR